MENDRERIKDEDYRQFYSYKILRDIYITSPLAMPSRDSRTYPSTNAHEYQRRIPFFGCCNRHGTTGTKEDKRSMRRETENLCRKEPMEKQDRIDVLTLKCKGASR